MAEDAERELSELRRRVYGADADLAGDPAAVARLAELERAGRAGATADDRHGRDGARADPDATDPAAGERDGPSGVNATTRWDDVSEPAESGHGTSGSAFEGAYRPRPIARPGVVDPAAGSEDLAARAARSRATEGEVPAPDAERTRPRWFSSAIVVTSAVAAVVVMLVAGAAGWGGGFLAGWARAASPADGMEFVTVLEEVELTEEVIESMGDNAWSIVEADPATGEIVGENRSMYFGDLGAGAHVVVSSTLWGAEEAQSDVVCMRVMQVYEHDESGSAMRGNAGCGSRRVELSMDMFVQEDGDGQYVPGLVSDDYDPGTLLRFVYDDASRAVSVWSLAPADELDPGV
ncbi:hypothetical protein [Microbacterium karelineae]|uniref:hypothetical protein n=1 Tax=Microbacterium karelineae TaxID=2654283 RepID=UPI0012EA08DC|nr:hypothetical protein [Microbacterium karelineae]